MAGPSPVKHFPVSNGYGVFLNEQWAQIVASIDPTVRASKTDDDVSKVAQDIWRGLSGRAKAEYQSRVPAGTVVVIPGEPANVPKHNTVPDEEEDSEPDSNSDQGDEDFFVAKKLRKPRKK
ncbi:unnamed protein product [Polarella glacialis]|uniref:Uncharacterized protein n=1 Tax=Polarella glacialis TaxID=89957 RepID=A0A813I2S4_POLGL|nr:unnamed protein product [Polarella glacialis]